MAAILVTAFRGGSAFAFLRLFAWSLFLHCPCLALVFAAILFRHRRYWSLLFATAAFSLVAIAGYAFLIEPTRLEVTRFEMVSTKVSRPVRIAVVADLQTDRFGEYERRASPPRHGRKPGPGALGRRLPAVR